MSSASEDDFEISKEEKKRIVEQKAGVKLRQRARLADQSSKRHSLTLTEAPHHPEKHLSPQLEPTHSSSADSISNDSEIERKLSNFLATAEKKIKASGVTLYSDSSTWRSKEGWRTVFATTASRRKKYNSSTHGQEKNKEYRSRSDVTVKNNENRKIIRAHKKEIGPFSCPHDSCDKVFVSTELLDGHIKCVHGAGPSTRTDYRNTALDYRKNFAVREQDMDTSDEGILHAVQHRHVKFEYSEIRFRNALVYIVVVISNEFGAEVKAIGLQKWLKKYADNGKIAIEWYVGKNVRHGIANYHYRLATSPLHAAVDNGCTLFLLKTYKFETDSKDYNQHRAKQLEAFINEYGITTKSVAANPGLQIKCLNKHHEIENYMKLTETDQRRCLKLAYIGIPLICINAVKCQEWHDNFGHYLWHGAVHIDKTCINITERFKTTGIVIDTAEN